MGVVVWACGSTGGDRPEVSSQRGPARGAWVYAELLDLLDLLPLYTLHSLDHLLSAACEDGGKQWLLMTLEPLRPLAHQDDGDVLARGG